MQDTGVVRRQERARQLSREPRRKPPPGSTDPVPVDRRQRLGAPIAAVVGRGVEHLTQGHAIDELEHQERRIVDVTEVENAYHAGMVDAFEGSPVATQVGARIGVDREAVEHLYGNVAAVVVQVTRTPDLAEPTGAEFADQLVAIEQAITGSSLPRHRTEHAIGFGDQLEELRAGRDIVDRLRPLPGIRLLAAVARLEKVGQQTPELGRVAAELSHPAASS